MVEPAIANIVRSAVSTDNPLASLDEVVIEGLEFLAKFTTSFCAGLDERFELGSRSFGRIGIILSCNLLFGSCFEVGWCVVLCDGLIEQHNNALLHLLVAKHHTHTEFAEVFKQRVIEGRPLSFVVCAIRSGRYGG